MIVAFLHCRNNAEVSMDIDLKKLNFQGLFKFFLDFSIGYEHFLNQNIKAEKVRPPPVWLLNEIAHFV